MKNFILLTGLLIFAALTFAHVPQNTLNEDGIRTGGDTKISIPGLNPACMMASGSEFLMPDEAGGETTQSHVIEFSKGWNGFSSYVNPENPAIETLFLAVQDQLIILYNQTGIYMPSQQLNTLVNWDPQSGYIAKFAQEATIEFSGQKMQNGMLSLSAGWNLIPVLSSCPVNVETLFGNSGVEVVKEVAGWKLYWPGFDINTIEELLPGSAYFVKMNSPAEISFPDCPVPQWQCGDVLVDSRDGKSYATVQIGNQCWMAENLNVGSMIEPPQSQLNNSIIEKYCYNGTQDSCDVYGGLYQWDEMMQYDTIAGRRGICPTGWHLPTDEEWKVLEGSADSQFGYPDPEWDNMGYRGFDACKNLKKSNDAWWINSGVDIFGFSALPVGNVSTEGQFENFSYYAHFWTSSVTSQSLGGGAYKRSLGGGTDQLNRYNNHSLYAFSVRCVKDTQPQPWSCGDPIIDTRDNQSYNTVQIGDQCWMAENLNVGTSVLSTNEMTDNGIIEKYCFDNNEDSCSFWGGLYQWFEMMQYNTSEGSQGICPTGWHIPSEAEWCQLAEFVDSSVDCEIGGSPGIDIGMKLKSADAWLNGGNGNDIYGFDALPSGFRDPGSALCTPGYYCDFWSSFSETNGNANRWAFTYQSNIIIHDMYSQMFGFSVRCIRDSQPQPWSCGDPIIDTRDNQSYNTVQIGDQCWMAENLNVGTMTAPIGESNNGIIEKICYNDNTANCDEYGGLYFWNEMMQYSPEEFNHGICPDGWHVPRLAEWDVLINSQGGTNLAGANLKETGFDHWDSPNTGATNQSGFTAFGGGVYAWGYDALKQMGLFWTSSQISGVEPVYKLFMNNSVEVTWDGAATEYHLYASLRCIKTACPSISTANAGADNLTVAGNSLILDGNDPANIEESVRWSIVSGSGGSFFDERNPHTAFTGNPAESYVLAYTISNYCGESDVDSVMIGFAPAAVSYCGNVTEITYEGQTYHTVQIGDQCWLKENLNVGQMIDGNTIQSDNSTLEKYCYNNEPDSCSAYGGLYQWNELMQYSGQPGAQGICPEGWHIPTDYDWCLLVSELDPEADCLTNISQTAGGKLKETGYEHWNFGNEGATNESGFTAVGSGSKGDFFYNIRETGEYVTSTRRTEGEFFIRHMSSYGPWITRGYYPVTIGLPVRCIKDKDLPVWSCGDPIIDTRDNQSYNTVQIGDQCWMAENMNVGTMIAPLSESDNGIIEKLCYDDNPANCDEYGGLYFWDEIMNYTTEEVNQGICPNGWRIPTKADWDYLVNVQGGLSLAGGNLKETGFDHWDAPNTGATNSSGFTALGGGLNAVGYYSLKQDGIFWTSSMEPYINEPIYGRLFHYSSEIYFDNAIPEWYMYLSLRCIKDIEQPSWSCGDPILDARDNQSYNTVQIGEQCWMAENMNAGTMINGITQTNNGVIERYCYENNEANCDIYGGLYEWPEAMQYLTNAGAQGICPDGWQIPKDGDWLILESFLGGSSIAGGKMKSIGTIEDGTGLWHTPNAGATNECGWTGYPGGIRAFNDGSFYYQGNEGYFWSSSQTSSFSAWWRGLNSNYASIDRDAGNGANGFSVRCIKACSPEPTQSNAGPDQLNISGTSALLAGNSPVNGAGVWSIVSGTGGTIESPASPSSVFLGLVGNEYTLSWTISTECGSSSDNVIISFGTASFSCGNSLVYEGQAYATVQIGDQCWMAENLNVGIQVNPYVQSNNGITEKLCFNNDGSNCDEYGALYEWNEMMNYSTNQTNQGICPSGWRVPMLSEWEALISFLGGASVAGGKLKETGFEHWDAPNSGATNESGFNAFGGGGFEDGFGLLNMYGNYWTSFFNGEDQILKYVRYNAESVETGYSYYEYHNAASVRCIKDNEPQTWGCGDPLLDSRDNQSYNTVQIGDQCWMAENLDYGIMIDSTLDPANNQLPEKYCFRSSEENCNEYGGLYHWQELMNYQTLPGTQGLCPQNWHIPTKDEWCAMAYFLDPTVNCNVESWTGTDAGGKLKETGYSHWLSPNTGATNESGFTALGSGHYSNHGFWSLGYASSFWTSEMYDLPGYIIPYYYILTNDEARIVRNASNQSFDPAGYSVRCILGDGQPPAWECGNSFIDARDNEVYLTTQIGDQCWMAENLNVGERINGSENQQDNLIIEKYCYDDVSSNCDEYGGLYQWNEMMEYETSEGAHGICPQGWHLPTEAEWCELTQNIDPTVDCNYLVGFTGTDVGDKMKSGSWQGLGFSNESGFSALPFGNRTLSGTFVDISYNAHFWTSKQSVPGSSRVWVLDGWQHGILHSELDQNFGFGVRCVKGSPPPQPWGCGDPLIDTRDNQSYNTVQIGEQCWMAENLNYGTMIPAGSSPTTESKYCYDDLDSNCQEYGGFYPWPQMMAGDPTPGSQGICPDGFHVPADEEWIALMNYLGGFSAAGGKMKESGYIHWLEPNEGATNESGFTALGTGNINPSFPTLNTSTCMWSSTPEAPGKAWYRRLAYNSSGLYREKTHGMAFPMSVRCLKNSDK